MKRFAFIFSAMALVGLSTVSAHAGLVLGIKGGIGIVTQDIAPDVEGAGVDVSTDVSPTFGGSIGYAIGENVLVGLLVEYQTTPVDASLLGYEASLGDADCVSVLPFVEWHFIGKRSAISPYLSLAAGININMFDVDDKIADAIRAVYGQDYDLDVDNTFGFKVGFGSDFFITEALAANLELGWKYNKGDVQEKLGGATVSEGDFNASNFAFTGGLRYYF